MQALLGCFGRPKASSPELQCVRTGERRTEQVWTSPISDGARADLRPLPAGNVGSLETVASLPTGGDADTVPTRSPVAGAHSVKPEVQPDQNRHIQPSGGRKQRALDVAESFKRSFVEIRGNKADPKESLAGSQAPLAVTVFSLQGVPLHQSPGSVAYFGDCSSGTVLASASTALRGRAASDTGTLLTQLFVHEPLKLEKLLNEVLREGGGPWRDVVRVPATLLPSSDTAIGSATRGRCNGASSNYSRASGGSSGLGGGLNGTAGAKDHGTIGAGLSYGNPGSGCHVSQSSAPGGSSEWPQRAAASSPHRTMSGASALRAEGALVCNGKMPQDTDAAPAATATPAAAAAAAIGSTPLSSGEDGVDLALPERPMLTTVDAFRGMLPERYKMPARNAMSACARAITVNLKASSLAPTRRGRYRIRMLQNLPSDTVAAAALGLPSAKCAPGLGGNDLCHSQPAEQCPSCTLAATAGAPAACAAPVEAGPGGRAPADAGSGSLPATGSGATTQASRSAALRMALEEVSDAGPGMQHAAHRSRTAASSPAPAPAAAVAGVAAGVEALAAMAGMGLCEMAPGAVTAELTSAIIAQQHALQEQQYQQAMSGTRSGHRSGSCTLAPDYQQGADDEPAVCHEVLAMCGRDAVTQEPVLIIAQYDVTTQLLAQLTGRTSPVRKVPFKFSALSTEPLNTNAPPSMRGSVNGVRVAGAPLGAGPAAAGAPAAADAASGVVPSLIPADEHTGFVPMGNRSYAESVSLTSVAQLSASGNQALVHSAQGSHASHAPTSSRSQRMRITRAPVSAVAEVEAAAGSTGGRIAAPDSATALQEAAAMLMDVLPDRALPQLNGTVSIAVPAAQQAAGGARVLQPGQPVSPPPPPQKQQQQQQQAAPAFSLALAGGGAVGVASGAVTRGPTTERLLANAAAEELLPEVLGEEHVVYAPNRSRRVVAPPGGLPGGTQAGGALADAGPMGGNRTAAWGSLMDPQCVPSARARRGRRLFGYAAGRDGAFDVLNQLEGDDSPLAMLHTDVPAPAYVADVDSSRPQMLYATAPPRLGQRQHGVSAASTPQGTTGAGESSATLQLSITAGGLCVGLVPTPVSSMHGAAAEPVTMTPAAVDSPAVAAAAALAASAVAGANGGRESPRFAGGHAAGAPLPPVEEATTTGTGTASSSNTRDQQLSTQQASGGIAEAPVENTAGTDVVGWPESSVASGASHGAGMALLRLMAPLHAHGFADAPPPRSRS